VVKQKTTRVAANALAATLVVWYNVFHRNVISATLFPFRGNIFAIGFITLFQVPPIRC
jgi:hypothetical protein